MSRSAIARRLLLVALLPALMGCGAEGDGRGSPITTVEAPAEVETQDFRDFDPDHHDDDEDDEGHDRDQGKGEGKGKDKAMPPGHVKKEDD